MNKRNNEKKDEVGGSSTTRRRSLQTQARPWTVSRLQNRLAGKFICCVHLSIPTLCVPPGWVFLRVTHRRLVSASTRPLNLSTSARDLNFETEQITDTVQRKGPVVAPDQKAIGDTPLLTHFLGSAGGGRGETRRTCSAPQLGVCREELRLYRAVGTHLRVLHDEAAGGSLRLPPLPPGSRGSLRHEQHPCAPGVSVRGTSLAPGPDCLRRPLLSAGWRGGLSPFKRCS